MSFPTQYTRVYNTFNLPTPQFKLTALGGLAIVRPGDNNRRSLFSGAAEAYAAYTFNIAGNRLNSPTHPVVWYNVKTNKPALTLQMLSDTGADYTTIDSSHARTLGIDDLKKGLQASVSGTGGTVENAFYIHKIPFRIGNLKVYNALVALGKGGGTNVLGRTSGLNWFNIAYTSKTVKYTELAQAQSALAQARWRNRI